MAENKYPEHAGAVTFKGNPLTLVGTPVAVGQKAPDFTAVRSDLTPAKLSDWQGQTILISSVPSLDTSVCDMQTRRFNEGAQKLGVKLLTLSMDLPFAQARWCGAAGIDTVVTLSDHRDADFGLKYGLLIKELRLLARAVFVVGADGTVKYMELVKEMTTPPNFDAALAACAEGGACGCGCCG